MNMAMSSSKRVKPFGFVEFVGFIGFVGFVEFVEFIGFVGFMIWDHL